MKKKQIAEEIVILLRQLVVNGHIRMAATVLKVYFIREWKLSDEVPAFFMRKYFEKHYADYVTFGGSVSVLLPVEVISMQRIQELLKQNAQFNKLKSTCDKDASLQSSEGMLYIRTLAKLALIKLELEKMEKAALRMRPSKIILVQL